MSAYAQICKFVDKLELWIELLAPIWRQSITWTRNSLSPLIKIYKSFQISETSMSNRGQLEASATHHSEIESFQLKVALKSFRCVQLGSVQFSTYV